MWSPAGQGPQREPRDPEVPGSGGAEPVREHRGLVLPGLISGTTIISIVLGLPPPVPFCYSLMGQDMYLAGSFLLLLSFLTILGTLISDILLAWLDPRIRLSD